MSMARRTGHWNAFLVAQLVNRSQGMLSAKLVREVPLA
jgi:hypothetical protein